MHYAVSVLSNIAQCLSPTYCDDKLGKPLYQSPVNLKPRIFCFILIGVDVAYCLKYETSQINSIWFKIKFLKYFINNSVVFVSIHEAVSHLHCTTVSFIADMP